MAPAEVSPAIYPRDPAYQLLDDICLRLMERGWTLAAGSSDDVRVLLRGKHRLELQHQLDPLSVIFQLGGHRVQLPMHKPDFAPFGDWPLGLGMEFWLAARHPQPDAHRRMHEEWIREQARAVEFPVRRAWVCWLLAALMLLMQNITTGRSDRIFVWGAPDVNWTFWRQPWRLIASSFLHDGWWAALPCALLTLYFGRKLERILGSLRLLAIWGASAVGALLTTRYLAWTEWINSGADGAVWGLLCAYALLAGPYRKRLPQPLRDGRGPLIFCSVLLLTELILVYRQWLFFDPWQHLGGGVAAVALTVLMLQRRWPGLARAVGATGVLVPACLTAALLTYRVYPRVEDYPRFSCWSPRRYFSVSLPQAFQRDGDGWVSPGIALSLHASELSESEAALDWPQESETVWASWRQEAMDWAAVDRLGNLTLNNRVWLLARLRPHDRSPTALCALTVDHEAFYQVTATFALDLGGREKDWLVALLDTLKVNHWTPAFYLGKASSYQDEGLLALPLRLTQRALEGQPENFGARLHEVYLLLELGKDARPSFEELKRLAHTDQQREAARKAEASVFAASNMARSRDILQDLLRSTPDRPELHNTLAWLEALYGDPTVALREARRALAAARTPDVLNTYAAVLLKLHRYDEALQALDECLRYRETVTDLFFRAQALEGLGRKKDALDAYAQIQEQPFLFQREAQRRYLALSASNRGK